jgi:hypothetical protein
VAAYRIVLELLQPYLRVERDHCAADAVLMKDANNRGDRFPDGLSGPRDRDEALV